MRRYLVIIALLAAAVGGVVVLALFRSPTLGLDLQGGLEVVLQAKAPRGREITQEDLDRSIEIMRERIDKIGVAEPVITRQGSNQIAVELADDLAHDFSLRCRADDAVDAGGAGLLGAQAHEIAHREAIAGIAQVAIVIGGQRGDREQLSTPVFFD